MWLMSGRYPREAARVFCEFENHSETRVVRIPDVWEISRLVPDPLPLQALARLPLLQDATGFEARRCKFWLEHDRGIPVWVQNMCRVRLEPDAQAVAFPLTDVSGRIFMIRMRSRREKRIWTWTAELAGVDEGFPNLKDAGVWFGMFLIDWTLPVMLVEAEMDAARLMALGYMNVIASAGSSVTDAQIDALIANQLILGYDDDKAGKHAHARIADRIGGKATMLEAKWGLARRKDGAPCKDAGELPDKDQLSIVLSSLKERRD
jgi:hypothetical protein